MNKIILNLVFFLLIASCKSRSNPSETQGIASHFLWQNYSLSLCYEDRIKLTEGLWDYTKLLTPIIQQEYSFNTTGIHFTGFQYCSQTPNAQIKVVLAEQLSTPGLFGVSASFGTQKFGNNPNLNYLYGSYGIVIGIAAHRNSSNPLQFLVWTVLHELGHVAGLQHEHAHKDSTCDKNESALGKFESMEFNVAAGSYHDYGTKYDQRSIMNYCSGFAFINGNTTDEFISDSNQATLSTCDRAMLKHLYIKESIPYYCKVDGVNPSLQPVFIEPNMRSYDQRNELPTPGYPQPQRQPPVHFD